MDRLKEIETRMAAIAAEIDTASGEGLTALEKEVNDLKGEREKINAEIETRAKMRRDVASGIIPATVIEQKEEKRMDMIDNETRAKKFVETNKMVIADEEVRSILVSSGTIATPTVVSNGINDTIGAKHSSILDMVNVVNCVGMGTHRVAYNAADSAAAGDQTEGQDASEKDWTPAYKDITPTSVAVIAYISDQVKKQSPIMYESKVRQEALVALRKNAVAKVVAALKASTLVSTLTADLDNSNKGEINENTLRDIAFAYGGNDGVTGSAVLFLNKTDLIAFGDVRGTNEKLPVYEITPDGSNPNIGTIKDGGLVVKYCITSGLTALSGTSQTSSAIKTMFYGQPQCLELDLFSNYEIAVSSDFKFAARLDTIRGSVDIGADVVVQDGFVAVTIASNA